MKNKLKNFKMLENRQKMGYKTISIKNKNGLKWILTS